MQNNELVTLFREIDRIDNCFDRFIALKNLRKKYKKSVFYKATKMSVFRAYKIHQANTLSIICALINNPTINSLARGDTLLLKLAIENFIEDFDTAKLDKIFDYIEEKLNGIDLNTTNVQAELQNIIKEFASSIAK